MLYKKIIKWLYPGMKIKRWLGLFALGVFIGSIGISLLLTYHYIGILEEYIFKMVYQLTGQYYALATIFGGLIIIIIGLFVVFIATQKLIYSVFMYALPEGEDSLLELIFKKRKLHKGPQIAAIGGGTGLSTLLRGLKSISSNISAIVTVADDGGSSGKLREDFGIIPPGDLRNCLVAMSDVEPLMERLMQHRFVGESVLSGHSFGNLFIAAMAQVNDGDMYKALNETSKILALRGRVVPSSLDKICLCAEMSDGTLVKGESSITKARKKINKIYLEPENAKTTKSVIEVILQAEIIILGPGSLYTSIIPNLLLPGVIEALHNTQAKKVYVCNVMTQPGETDGYTASDHLKFLLKYGSEKLVDYVVVNVQPIAQNLKNIYEADGAYPVLADIEEIEKMGIKVIQANLISETNLVRHDPLKLSRTIVKLIYDLQSKKTKVWDRFLIKDNELKLSK